MPSRTFHANNITGFGLTVVHGGFNTDNWVVAGTSFTNIQGSVSATRLNAGANFNARAEVTGVISGNWNFLGTPLVPEDARITSIRLRMSGLVNLLARS